MEGKIIDTTVYSFCVAAVAKYTVMWQHLKDMYRGNKGSRNEKIYAVLATTENTFTT